MTAVHSDVGSGHENGQIGHQQEQGPIQVLRLTEAPLRDAFDQCLTGIRLKEVAVDIGFDIARIQAVDPNAISRPFQGQGAGQLQQSGL